MKLRWPFQLIFLSVIVLCIYYPTLSAEVSLVDDQDVIANIFNSELPTIQNIFVPRTQDGGYYRPFIGLGYYIDKSLWDLNIRAMHLENIIMHLVNVLLVYFLAFVACRDSGEKKSNDVLPLISATLFALHPIVTESVNWISGRTDPMAANFVLSSAILLIVYRRSRKIIHITAAIVLILLGILAKEASLGMVLASGVILSAQRKSSLDDSIRSAGGTLWSSHVSIFLAFYSLIVIEVLYLGNYWAAIAGVFAYAVYLVKPWQTLHSGKTLLYNQLLRLFGTFAISSSVLIALYTVLRKIAFRSDASKICHTLKLILDDTNYAISMFLGASGFYLKKFFLPLPLNFFILEIDPLYDLAGILVLLFCIYLMTRLSLASALFLAGICMFIPALPFAFGTIAWTGYAERYIYLSSAFWVVSITIYLDNLARQHEIVEKACKVAVVVLIVFFGCQTFVRNIVWQKNVTILADTVEKSPKQPVIREMYMQALVNAKRYDLAKEQYTIGTSRSIFFSEGPDLIMAQILMQEGKTDKALALCEKALVKSRYKSERALKATVGLIDKMMEGNQSRANGLLEKKSHYESLLLEISKDPMVFYNMGQKALATGDSHSATSLFERANSAFPESSPYKEYSQRLITRLNKDTK